MFSLELYFNLSEIAWSKKLFLAYYPATNLLHMIYLNFHLLRVF